MARRQSTSGVADRDVFDDPPEGPVGVHRGSRSWVVRIAPVVIAFLVAALVGLVVWGTVSGQASRLMSLAGGSSSSSVASTAASSSSSSAAASSSSASSSATASASSADASSSSATDESSSSSSSASQAVNKSTSVRVVNATSVTGYAARKAAVLTEAGYTSVVAANPSGSTPSQTVVWYQNETDEATAQDVASRLGISSVKQMSGLSAPIVVVLLS